jgi:cell division transport system permease protein
MSRDPSARGARQSRTGIADLWQAWQQHHRTSALDSFGRLAEAPLQTLMTALVVAIALALPTTLLLALGNVQSLGDRWDSGPKMTVFLKLGAQDAAITRLRDELQQMPEIQAMEYISSAQALQSFQAQSGFSEALAALETNPLPPTLVITPANIAVEPVSLDAFRQRIAADPLVDEVSLDMEWVRRLNAIMELGKQLVLGLALLLGAGVLLVIGNTIRLEIESRRDEIVVVKLVGATDGFVRRPFLYTGFWYGVIGGLIACLLVSTGVASLAGPVRALAATYQDTFILRGLGLGGCAALVGSCIALGLLGAWLAVGRHLSAIEPR